MANKKTVRKNKNKRKSRRRGGGVNRSLKPTTISVFKAQLQAAQQEEARREAEQRRREEEQRRREEEQRRREAEAKRLLAEAAKKPEKWIEDKADKEKAAREESLRSLFSAYGQ